MLIPGTSVRADEVSGLTQQPANTIVPNRRRGDDGFAACVHYSLEQEVTAMELKYKGSDSHSSPFSYSLVLQANLKPGEAVLSHDERPIDEVVAHVKESCQVSIAVAKDADQAVFFTVFGGARYAVDANELVLMPSDPETSYDVGVTITNDAGMAAAAIPLKVRVVTSGGGDVA